MTEQAIAPTPLTAGRCWTPRRNRTRDERLAWQQLILKVVLPSGCKVDLGPPSKPDEHRR